MKKQITDQRRRVSNDEKMVASALIAQLLAEGRAVQDRKRPSTSGGRSPDFVVALDGSVVALEVVRFLDPEAAKAWAVVRLVEKAMKPSLDLAARGLGCKLVLGVNFAVWPLQRYGRLEIDRDARALASSILGSIHLSQHVLALGLRLATDLPWIEAADIFAYPSPEPSFFIGSLAPERRYAEPEASQFLDRTIEQKQTQHLGHADKAILAIRSHFDSSEELSRAFGETTHAIPWWRVYNVWGGGEARLVFEGT